MSTVSFWLNEELLALTHHITSPDAHPLPPSMRHEVSDLAPADLIRQIQAITTHLRAKPFPSPLPPSAVSRALIHALVDRCNAEPHPSHVPAIRTATRSFAEAPVTYIDCFAPHVFTSEQRATLSKALCQQRTPYLISWHRDTTLGGGARYIAHGTLVDASLRGSIERLFSSSTLSL